MIASSATLDRYEEREQLLKTNIYKGINADILGLQEVAFGRDGQLDELSQDRDTSKYFIDAQRSMYQQWLAPSQIKYGLFSKNTDSGFRIDGNVILADCSSYGEVVSHELLHLSSVRVAQKIVLKIHNSSKRLNVFNTHLHHLEKDLCLRMDQALGLCTWALSTCSDPDDIIVLLGDFNSTPSDPVYDLLVQNGFKSAYKEVHGKEPIITFPSGIVAPTMDTDTPGCMDYIWYKGDGFEVVNASVEGKDAKEGDNTIYGSDHFSVCADFQLPQA